MAMQDPLVIRKQFDRLAEQRVGLVESSHVAQDFSGEDPANGLVRKPLQQCASPRQRRRQVSPLLGKEGILISDPKLTGKTHDRLCQDLLGALNLSGSGKGLTCL